MSFRLPNGCFPTMITPMTSEGEIDFQRLNAITEWYIQAGCTGLFANCLSSEMYDLSPEERVQITRAVTDKAAGRVTVVASGGLGCASIEEHASVVKQMGAVCDAVVVVVNQMAKEDEGDDVWKRNVERLLELTGDIPLGLYECPKPYHRLLSADQLAWAASTGRFYFHKDTCCQLEPIKAKLAALERLPQTIPFKFYNANVATLLSSVRAGANGFSGISANFYPQLLVWLTANPQHEMSEHVQDMLSVAENVVADTYPLSAKMFQTLFEGFDGSTRTRCLGDATLNEEQHLKLQALHRVMASLSRDLGLVVLNPAKVL
ncbi:hypothetical protein PTSG_03199 [Salpingoeca rosetta]|uniref:Dihydrodipicolinate synthase n=1 Tax=Salpingoeca rosetta (strain ATCC 50818 / BSB-021) TaxID=946362 RepID=F2U4I1_SALR5|nr:uncharacterized protein PTSG_03199 [Salpingoeca rosetta]EGD82547.1 hypothetical protein PTSG_03199 [Salpingoeca rosetta]|eukprot:XP_004995783.1 hypothetical protein PTSG_03199 [Salpingoeca rosetta]